MTDMKIFAFATDDKGLMVFSDKAEAVAYCEGIDVENGVWQFWDEQGIRMKAKFYEPNEKGRYWVVSGKYDLVSNPEGCMLQDFLSDVVYLKENGVFKDLNDVRKHLIRVTKSLHD